MDALSEVLRIVRVESSTCYRLDLSTPWSVRMNELNGTVFIAVVQGSIWLEVWGIETPMPLIGGDLVVLNKGQSHRLRDSWEENPDLIEFDELVAVNKGSSNVLQIGDGGLLTTVIYGRFSFSPLPENPLLSALPALLIIKGEEKKAVEWLDTTLEFLASEIANTPPGAEIVINHLASILLIQSVRAYVSDRECGDRCWLKALNDPIIGKAINLIHQHPEYSWTVDELASRVAIGRTTFFNQFRDLVGEPPGKYLTRWRMQRASQILRLEQITLDRIAGLVGYESEASFSKAFKQWTGQSPGSYRRKISR